MILAFLVFTRRWDVFGRAQYGDNFWEFFGSASLAGIEALVELHTILYLTGVA